jgi:hypothetical protein
MSDDTAAIDGRIQQIEAVIRDIGTVMTVAQRRSDPDDDHRAMLARLQQWRAQLIQASSGPSSPRSPEGVTGEDFWMDELEFQLGKPLTPTGRDCLRSWLRAFAAHIRRQPKADPPQRVHDAIWDDAVICSACERPMERSTFGFDGTASRVSYFCGGCDHGFQIERKGEDPPASGSRVAPPAECAHEVEAMARYCRKCGHDFFPQEAGRTPPEQP